MRILHTSDWHLGAALRGQHDRAKELFTQVERICELAQEHKVDLLVVAGDVFVRRNMLESTKTLAKILSPYIKRGLKVLIFPGNHDDKEHFYMMRALLSVEEKQRDQIYIIDKSEVITINNIQFVIVPYPNIPELLEPYKIEASGAKNRNAVLSKAYAELVDTLLASLDPNLPATLFAHLSISGVISHSEKEVNYDEGILMERNSLPFAPNLTYIGLGHIHQCQKIPHKIPCYYSGSMERMDMGERDDDKFVLLVEIPSTRIANITKLPLPVTPFYDISINALELDSLLALYPDLRESFFRLNIDCEIDDEPIAVQRRVKELVDKFSLRCLDVICISNQPILSTREVTKTPQDYAKTVLDYLYEKHFEDPDLLALEDRAKLLMQEVNNALAKN
ncbi:MAG: exonuclease subunit SbcD [Acidobacteria bacterium]|nr:exonuclease subunit SbcD [Acidobacteriota bacterium]